MKKLLFTISNYNVIGMRRMEEEGKLKENPLKEVKGKLILNQNGYPTRLFDRCVRLFLDQTFQPKELIHSVSRKVVYFCLPYTGTHSLQIRTQIQRLCSVAYPPISIRIVFRPHSTFVQFLHV